MAYQYIVVRLFKTSTGKPRALAAGPFPTHSKAKSYMDKFLREEWYLPRSEFFVAPLRPIESELRTFQES